MIPNSQMRKLGFREVTEASGRAKMGILLSSPTPDTTCASFLSGHQSLGPGPVLWWVLGKCLLKGAQRTGGWTKQGCLARKQQRQP